MPKYIRLCTTTCIHISCCGRVCNNDDEISPLKQNLVTAYLYVYLSNDTPDIHTYYQM